MEEIVFVYIDKLLNNPKICSVWQHENIYVDQYT